MAAPENRSKRRFLRGSLLTLGAGGAGFFIGRRAVASPLDFDFLRDAPVGIIIHYEGALNAHPNLPSGSDPKWSVIAADRAIIGASSEAEDGDEGGSESLTAGPSHTGSAVGNHVFTQPGNHAAHATAGGHTHNSHGTSLGSLVVGTVLTSPVTHSNDGGHAHDAHSAHAGGAVDAHAVTQPSSHAVKKWRKSFTLLKTVS